MSGSTGTSLNTGDIEDTIGDSNGQRRNLTFGPARMTCIAPWRFTLYMFEPRRRKSRVGRTNVPHPLKLSPSARWPSPWAIFWRSMSTEMYPSTPRDLVRN
jgi:hypothetical protein